MIGPLVFSNICKILNIVITCVQQIDFYALDHASTSFQLRMMIIIITIIIILLLLLSLLLLLLLLNYWKVRDKGCETRYSRVEWLASGLRWTQIRE